MDTQNSTSNKNNSSQDSQNIHDVFKENFDNYFHEVERVMPRYLEFTTHLQTEFLDAWKNTINASLDLQKEYSEKTDMNSHIPQAAVEIIYSITEEYIKSKKIQNQVILSTLNSTKNTFKDSQNSFEPFMEINKKILSYWYGFYSKK